MSAPVLALVHRNAAQTIDVAFAADWSASDLEKLLREVEGAVREFAGLPNRVQNYQEQCYLLLETAAEKRQAIDHQLLGESLIEMFDSAIVLMKTLLKWMQRLEQAGHPARGAAELVVRIGEIEKQRGEALERWPWPPTPEEAAEAIAEYERGDSLPLDEAFAEIAGVSKEEWLARAERRRQELRGRGGVG